MYYTFIIIVYAIVTCLCNASMLRIGALYSKGIGLQTFIYPGNFAKAKSMIPLYDKGILYFDTLLGEEAFKLIVEAARPMQVVASIVFTGAPGSIEISAFIFNSQLVELVYSYRYLGPEWTRSPLIATFSHRGSAFTIVAVRGSADARDSGAEMTGLRYILHQIKNTYGSDHQILVTGMFYELDQELQMVDMTPLLPVNLLTHTKYECPVGEPCCSSWRRPVVRLFSSSSMSALVANAWINTFWELGYSAGDMVGLLYQYPAEVYYRPDETSANQHPVHLNSIQADLLGPFVVNFPRRNKRNFRIVTENLIQFLVCVGHEPVVRPNAGAFNKVALEYEWVWQRAKQLARNLPVDKPVQLQQYPQCPLPEPSVLDGPHSSQHRVPE